MSAGCLALAVALQWADAMTAALLFAVVGTTGELNPLPLGVGGTLLAKAGVMLAVLLVARRRVAGHRVLVAWTAALGMLGFAANSAFMLGAGR